MVSELIAERRHTKMSGSCHIQVIPTSLLETKITLQHIILVTTAKYFLNAILTLIQILVITNIHTMKLK